MAGEQEVERAERQLSLWQALQRRSRRIILGIVMRAGGEAFGAPFEAGVATLTEGVVKRLHQRGFFAFETLEQARERSRRNKFTRHGAAPFRGSYQQLAPSVAAGGAVDRVLRYLRQNRYFVGRRS